MALLAGLTTAIQEKSPPIFPQIHKTRTRRQVGSTGAIGSGTTGSLIGIECTAALRTRVKMREVGGYEPWRSGLRSQNQETCRRIFLSLPGKPTRIRVGKALAIGLEPATSGRAKNNFSRSKRHAPTREVCD